MENAVEIENGCSSGNEHECHGMAVFTRPKDVKVPVISTLGRAVLHSAAFSCVFSRVVVKL